jgi:rod shape-determining protein MreC
LGAAWDGLCNGPSRDDATEERERLLVLLKNYQVIEEENEALRESLQWQKQQPYHVVCAPIWSHGGGLGTWPRLTLGLGANAGISLGDAVVAPEGLIGRIDVLHANTSEVVLISDPACRIAVEIPNITKGITQGNAGRDFSEIDEASMLYTAKPLTLKFLTTNTPIQPGLVAITEGSGGLFPRGIVIGTVIETRLASDGLLCEADIRPAVNPSLLNSVFIMTRRPAIVEASIHE